MARARSPLALLLAAMLVAGCGTTQTSPSPVPTASTPAASAPAASPSAGADWHDATLAPAARAAGPPRPDVDRGEDRPDDPARDRARSTRRASTDLLLGLGPQRRRRRSRHRTTPPAGTRWSRTTRTRRSTRGSASRSLYGVDAVHGHNNVAGATIFPQQVGLGASHDADLVKRIGAGDRARDGRHRHPLGLRAGRGRAAGRPLGPGVRGLRRGPDSRSRSWPRRSSRGSRATT